MNVSASDRILFTWRFYNMIHVFYLHTITCFALSSSDSPSILSDTEFDVFITASFCNSKNSFSSICCKREAWLSDRSFIVNIYSTKNNISKVQNAQLYLWSYSTDSVGWFLVIYRRPSDRGWNLSVFAFHFHQFSDN